MTANLQLLTTIPKTKTKTKQTSRTGIEPQKWRSHVGLSVGVQVGKEGEKVQRISSIDDRWKIDRGRVRIVQEMQKPKNLYVRPMDMN